ncbi:hypothetical protein Tsubulata_008419 [Turnera subulata]|uniref:Carbonic anhydrase n=1 Tax=Turnera subulata TaxID=218843 RepID=A0A9Q0GA22_9ROSI|nr:hypothetical protein Tsubulata_008419 [Turnera subulata]
MASPIRSKARSLITSVDNLIPFLGNGVSFQFPRFSGITHPSTGLLRDWHSSTSRMKLPKVDDTRVESSASIKKNPICGWDASVSCHGLATEAPSFKVESIPESKDGLDLFDEMKQRFLREEAERFQALSEMQSPKFMVIACVDSRVCPSNILGFQPGEAFMVRNVANLVPPLENGPTETNAALEFAVNTLQVEHIFVVGHSSCAGIQALMNKQENDNSSYVQKWVANAKVAKLRTISESTHLSFDQQCKHCEKESINCSLLNLLTYPWIEEKVRKDLLSLHGGYYDFLNCTFERWTLDYSGSRFGGFSVKHRSFWC